MARKGVIVIAVILLIGYCLGAKFPSAAQRLGVA